MEYPNERVIDKAQVEDGSRSQTFWKKRSDLQIVLFGEGKQTAKEIRQLGSRFISFGEGMTTNSL